LTGLPPQIEGGKRAESPREKRPCTGSTGRWRSTCVYGQWGQRAGWRRWIDCQPPPVMWRADQLLRLDYSPTLGCLVDPSTRGAVASHVLISWQRTERLPRSSHFGIQEHTIAKM